VIHVVCVWGCTVRSPEEWVGGVGVGGGGEGEVVRGGVGVVSGEGLGTGT